MSTDKVPADKLCEAVDYLRIMQASSPGFTEGRLDLLLAEHDRRGAELERLREVLAGTAPAEGSWQVEALALRAEVERLLEVNGDLMTESRQLHARDEVLSQLLRESARQTSGHRIEARSWRKLLAEASAENDALRARDDAAKAVVQWWAARKASQPVPPKYLHIYDGVDALDALSRAHDPQEQAMQELVAQSEELGLYEDGGQDR